MKHRLAKLIEVDVSPEGASIVIDGEAFPFYVTSGITIEQGDVPSVTVTVLAEQVCLTHRIDAP